MHVNTTWHCQWAHLYCLAVRHATVHRNLRYCQSSSSSSRRRSRTRRTACISTTTTTAVAATTTTTCRSGRSSSSRVGRGVNTTGCGVGRRGSAWGGDSCVDQSSCGVGCCSSGLRLTLHGALCSSHLWPTALLDGSSVPEEKEQHKRKKSNKLQHNTWRS